MWNNSRSFRRDFLESDEMLKTIIKNDHLFEQITCMMILHFNSILAQLHQQHQQH